MRNFLAITLALATCLAVPHPNIPATSSSDFSFLLNGEALDKLTLDERVNLRQALEVLVNDGGENAHQAQFIIAKLTEMEDNLVGKPSAFPVLHNSIFFFLSRLTCTLHFADHHQRVNWAKNVIHKIANKPEAKSSDSKYGLNLIFEDNFNSLDHSTWTHEITMSGGGNW
jgi:hypothetical protein